MGIYASDLLDFGPLTCTENNAWAEMIQWVSSSKIENHCRRNESQKVVHTQLRGPNGCKGLLGGECRLLTMASTSFGSQIMLG